MRTIEEVGEFVRWLTYAEEEGHRYRLICRNFLKYVNNLKDKETRKLERHKIKIMGSVGWDFCEQCRRLRAQLRKLIKEKPTAEEMATRSEMLKALKIEAVQSLNRLETWHNVQLKKWSDWEGEPAQEKGHKLQKFRELVSILSE